MYLPEVASGYASGRTTTVTGAGGAPRVDPRGRELEGAGAGASSCVVPPSFLLI